MLPRYALAASLLAVGFLPGGASAQQQLPTVNPQTKFMSGQNVVPAYEGWLRNKDGTFSFVFGYFNRNWQEELVIPPGPDNKIEPGAVDRGQPTYFLPRRQRWLFRVQVPADWGMKELIWTLTSHGRTEKAYATLMPEEEILERQIQTNGNLNPGEDDPNQPPSVTIAPVASASVASPLTLTALVTDDGLPKPRPPRAPRAGAIPQAQTNNAGVERPRGLNARWMEIRGPAKVTFDPVGPTLVANGQSVTVAHFTEPGTYVLRATANDIALSTTADITITVK